MTDKITNHSQRDVKKVANDTNSVCDSLHLGAKPSDKIQEELEKEIERLKKHNVIPDWTEAKLSQHLATKQAMIKDEIEFLEALQLGFIAKDFITPSKKDKVTEKFIKERIAKLNAEKQKLGELKT